jgi:hypothetical protein
MVVSPVENVLLRKMGSEAVLLNMKTETYYMLNSTGIRMWELLSSGISVDDAVMLLANEYSVTPEVIRSDMDEFIQSLETAKLVDIQK